MEYERIHKVQVGVISPSKLRMKILGAHNCLRKEGGSNSSRTSPSKLEDMEYAKNSLLAAQNGDLDEEVSSKDSIGTSALHSAPNSQVSRLELSVKEMLGYNQSNRTNSCQKDLISKEKADTSRVKIQNFSKGVSYQAQPNNNLSTVHPVRSLEEDSVDYDSGHDNGSTSSFEFHQGERTVQNHVGSPYFRHVPYKWNDAEKWIVNRQKMHPNFLKKNVPQNHGNRQMVSNWARVAPESTEQKHSIIQAADTKRIDSAPSTSQSVVEKFAFVPYRSHSNSISAIETSDSGSLARLQQELNHEESSVKEKPVAETEATPTVQSVSMRDVGTEMTPIASQEPSRTGTPLGATTPTRSPTSSMPPTPRRRAPAPSPLEATSDDESDCQKKGSKSELSDRELQLKTRREIVALGIQLGKMNIASWASKDEVEHASPSLKTLDVDQLEKIEYETRAKAWEEAEQSKHMARYKREEVKIQAWESHQKAKFEAKMRKVEVQVEQIRTRAQENMMKKSTITRRRVEDKKVAAEHRLNRQAARAAQQVGQIRRTGHVPASYYLCCSWFS